MKFKKEDIGMYLGCVAIGTSLGLLAGAVATTVVNRRRDRKRLEELEELDDILDELVEVSENEGSPNAFFNTELSRAVENERVYAEHMAHIDRIDKADEEEARKMEEELQAFIEEYEPNQVQIEFIRSGTATIEEVKEVLTEAETYISPEPTDYSAPYRKTAEEISAEKPDMEEIVRMPEDEGEIDEFWTLSTVLPSHKRPDLIKPIFWDRSDPEKDAYVQQHPSGSILPMSTLENIMSASTAAFARQYVDTGFSPIFITDKRTNKVYSFEELGEDDVE